MLLSAPPRPRGRPRAMLLSAASPEPLLPRGAGGRAALLPRRVPHWGARQRLRHRHCERWRRRTCCCTATGHCWTEPTHGQLVGRQALPCLLPCGVLATLLTLR